MRSGQSWKRSFEAMRFDTHLHVWWPCDGADVRIRGNLPELNRRFDFETARPLLQDAGVSKVILVSAAQEEGDNERLLRVGQANSDLVAGVIGWLDLEAPDVARRVARWQREALWRGVRVPLTIHEDRHCIVRPEMHRGLRALAEANAIAEILAAPDQLLDVRRALEPIPGLRVVIDHAGSPDFSRPPSSEWQEGMAALAELNDVVCKVSAFWMPGNPPLDDATASAFFHHVVATFGPSRMIAAANWPVASLTRTYGATWELLDRLASIAGLNEEAAQAICVHNARAFFGGTCAPVA